MCKILTLLITILFFTEEIEEEMDEETREFNFWTHQIHIFFLRKLFPAYEHMLEMQSGRERLLIEKEVGATVIMLFYHF